MNRKSQHGVALVITLLMLSVVTFMAVAFLALSRREREIMDIVYARGEVSALDVVAALDERLDYERGG